jgi:MFS family permease
MAHMPRVSKPVYFVIEALNSLGTSFYYFNLFFFMTREFGFGNLGNLGLSATNGFLYMFAARYAGRYGQQRGYHRALRIGFTVMFGAMIIAFVSRSAAGQLAVMAVWTLGMCFTWPTLEAVVSEGESPARLQRSLGIYNLIWAGGSAFSYFAGSAILELFGPRSLFVIPALMHALQWIVLTLADRGFWPARNADSRPLKIPDTAIELNPRPIARTKVFLKLAWMANPFAYVAINTVAATMPTLASRLGLSPMLVGVFCSIWFFARLGTFLLLWLWPGWHYRLGWFLAACVSLIVSFVGISLGHARWVVIASQIVFGIAIGLVYSSSLYYSMDAGDSKGEHGGIHESVIGAGIFLGPAVGMVGMILFPSQPDIVTWFVGTLLVFGMGAVGFVAARFVWERQRGA